MYWWIGEGFIDLLDKEKLICSEHTTDELIKELMAKGMVEPVSRKQHPVVHIYKMHPFIRYVVIMLAKKQVSLILMRPGISPLNHKFLEGLSW